MSRGTTCKAAYSRLKRGEEAEKVGLKKTLYPNQKGENRHQRTTKQGMKRNQSNFASTTIGSTFISGTF
ncbi:hypothetical protein E1B28_002648 [Marasmius oreades]|uniref:Uncharacterized protein n=1 Tax=Marasmius oreades TaxID=181124 RepID=A0A9P7RNH3_9AGAR|nr:uncharacterized protein E1B28_002648 [Marasmius oreades]KAG7086712.1 hypothetical protein E1B28_002648 [Marasmius oreades]